MSLLHPERFYAAIALLWAVLFYFAMKAGHAAERRAEDFERARRDYGRASLH